MSNSQYQVGGSLSATAPSYIHRQADRDLYTALQAGHFCYVFNSRQMGKSSLRVQTMHRFKQAGVACLAIDMTRIGSEHLTPQQWYEQVISELWRAASLPGKVNLKHWLQDHPELSLVPLLAQFIEEVLLVQIHQSQIIIFIDEIDTLLSINFPINDFFAFIRACYNQRVDHPGYQRLTFCLLGVATPTDLMQDKTRTPFNIGQAIALHGFTVQEAQLLAQGLVGIVPHPDQTLQDILHWTGGQPFLTQKLCQLVTQNPHLSTHPHLPASPHLVQLHLLHNWESHDEPEHLRTIRDRLLRNEKQASQLLGIYAEILQQGEIPADDGDGQMELRLTGLVIKQGDRLTVYNPIYAAVFNHEWVEKTLNDLRPYADSIRTWQASDKRDDSRLLRGQALEEALAWSATHNLSNLDTEFLRASQAIENRETKQANEILATANRKAKQRLQIGAIGLGFALAAAAGIGIWSNQTIQSANRSLQLSRQSAQSAKFVTRLEQNSRNVLERFKSDQTEALRSALRYAFELKQLRQQEKTQKYLTFSPILALQKIADNIQIKGNPKITPSQRILSSAKGYRVVDWHGDNQSGNITFRLWDFTSGVRLASFVHPGGFEGFALSPNGQWFATTSGDCTTRLWNLQSQPVMTFNRHQGPLQTIQFSPDSNFVLTSELAHSMSSNPPNPEKCRIQGDSGIARLLDRQGRQQAEFKHLASSVPIQFNPTGDRLLTLESQPITVRQAVRQGNEWTSPIYSSKSQIQLWTLQRKSLLTLLPKQADGIFSLARFSPQGERIAAVERKEKIAKIRLWDLQGKELANFPVFEGGDLGGQTEILQFSPNGQLLATGGSDSMVRLWNSQGSLIRQFKAYTGAIDSIAFNPSGTQLAIAGQLNLGSGSRHFAAHLWDLQGNRLKPIRTQNGRFSPDGTQIVDYASIEYLDNPREKTLGQDQGQVQVVQFSPTGKHIITYTEASGKVQVWDRQGNRVADINTGFLSRTGSGVPIRFNAKGDRILTAEFPNYTRQNKYGVRVWNLQGKQVAFLDRAEWPANPNPPSDYWVSGYIAPQPKTLSSDQSWIPSLRIWQLDGKPVATLNAYTLNTYDSESIKISPRGNYILTKNGNASTLWNKKGQKIAHYPDLSLETGSGDLRNAYFSQDEQRLIMLRPNPRDRDDWSFTQRDLRGKPVGIKISLKRFDPQPEHCLVFECAGTDSPPQYSPQMNYFWKEGYPAVLWNFDGEPIATVGSVFGSVFGILSNELVQFSDRGDRIATAGGDGKIRVWDNHGNQLGEYEGYAMALSPDGKQIVVVSQADNISRIWRVDDLDGLIQRGCDWLKTELAIAEDSMCNNRPE